MLYAMSLAPGRFYSALADAQPTVSCHLAELRGCGIVSRRRAGRCAYYRIRTGLPVWAAEVMRATAAGIAGQGQCAADREALATMPNRRGAPRCA